MPTAVTVHRIEVSPAPGHADPLGDSIKHDAAAIGIPLSRARATHVYLIQARSSALTPSHIDTIRTRLLADPITEVSRTGAAPHHHPHSPPARSQLIEIHPLPGVMDPVAQSVQSAIRELLNLAESDTPQVSTGWRYDLEGGDGNGKPLTADEALTVATRLLANPVIQRIHTTPFHPEAFPVGKSHDHAVRSIALLDLTDDQLTRLSRDAHLFLSLEEMRAVQSHYRSIRRDPTDIELETLAQTWSEHCVHKTLKSTIRYSPASTSPEQSEGFPDPINWRDRPNHTANPDGSITIRNLLKSTVAAATHQLIKDGLDWTLSVFVDNSGVIAFDDDHAVCIKVETHNHPSAIEPYGGAATGVGGCIRDVIATGLGARPIANTDVFCVAYPDSKDVPAGCLPPRRILTQVVAGVRDYGNRMGIPTVNGAVAFDNRYVGNPLVYCGCIGVMPRSRVKGKVNSGDLIVALGGRTGRDGIHGATFSSAELEHSAADEFSHAVQIGNAITEKQTLDAIMRAAEVQPRPLFTAMTDCGAGGFSSAIGELGKDTGATVNLDLAPLKYDGLSYTEIWISEAQERFVLAVPPKNLAALQAICDEESVELAVLGEFAPPEGSTLESPDLRLLFKGAEVGRMSMHFLHEGIPTPTREATYTPRRRASQAKSTPLASTTAALLRLLADPNIASKHWIIRQYDHEVRGATVIKPLLGPDLRGPSDASVILPVPGSYRGLAIACGLQTAFGDPESGGDPYLMTLAAVDECIRNLVCVGADPDRVAILDNFCWPSCGKPENLGSLVRAAEGCYDAAMAYNTPFVSGKDSLNNQFTTQDGRTIEIPPTLLITGIGIVADVRKCVTSDAKEPGNVLFLVNGGDSGLGGSVFERLFGGSGAMPRVDLGIGPKVAKAVFGLISAGLVRSAHDCSEGGLLVAVAEMLIGGSTAGKPIGAQVEAAEWFGEAPSRYVLEVRPGDLNKVVALLKGCDIVGRVLGTLDDSGRLDLRGGLGGESVAVEAMAEAWTKTLDW